MSEVQYIRLQLLGGDNDYWNLNKNQVLKNRELGYNSDTGELKLGDGESTWSNLKGFKEPVPFYINGAGGSYINNILSLPNQSTLYYNNGEPHGNPDYNKRGWYIYNESLKSTSITTDPRTHGFVRILTIDDTDQFVSINPSTFQIINNLGSIILEDDYISIYSEDSSRQNKSVSLNVDKIVLEDKNGLEVQLNFPEHSGTIILDEDLDKVAADLRLETNSIRAALDLAEITATMEIEDKYNYRQTADGLTSLWKGQPTTLLKVEGDTITTINRLDLSSVNNSILEITENGKKITAIANGSYMSSPIGVLQDLCPTIHIGDVVYLYCKDGTAVLPNGLVDANNSVVIPVNTATTITAEMLATTVHLGVIPFTQGFVIEDLQITKVQNAPWTPYFNGLKSAEFAGVEITGKNLFNPNRTERDFGSSASTTNRTFTKNSFYVGLSPNNYYVPAIGYKIDSYSYENGAISVKIKAGGESYGIGLNFDCKGKESYCVQFNTTVNGKCKVSFYGDGQLIRYGNVANKGYITTPENCNQFVLIFTSAVVDELVHFTDIQVQIGTTATEYTPYIEPYIFNFPNTVNPLGQTIDFENKKIVDYGVELVLKGTEPWGTYRYNGTDAPSPYAIILPTIEAGNTNTFTTDGFIVPATNNVGRIQIGHGSQNLWWRGAFEYLGLDASWADKINPTSAELSTALSNFKAYLAQRYADGNPVTIRYVTTSVQSETPFTEAQTAAGDSYIPYIGGTEMVENANAGWGLENTITQEYEIINKIGG